MKQVCRKILALLLSCFMVLDLGIIPVSAAEAEEDTVNVSLLSASSGVVKYSGTAGDLDWSITEDGLLTIEGTGDYGDDRAWSIYTGEITSAIVNVDGITSTSLMFYNCGYLEEVDLSGLDTSNVTDMSYMFADCSSLASLDVSGFDTSNVTDMSFMFRQCRSLTSLDVSGFDTSNVTDMRYMFYYCSSLTSLDLSEFNTSKVTDMSGMFSNCGSLTSLNVSSFDTSNVTDMDYVFYSCTRLTDLDVSGFNTSNVTNMKSMFYACWSLTSLDVSGFDTSNVTNMYEMFWACYGLTSLDVSGFDTGNVTNMSYMFDGCSKLTSLDLSNFDTCNVTSIECMLPDYTDALNWVRMPAYLVSDVELPSSYDDDYWLDENSEVCTVAASGLTTPMTYSRKSYLDSNPDGTSDEGYTIEVMANSSNCSTEIGDDLLLSFVLFKDGEAVGMNYVTYDFTWSDVSGSSEVYTYTGEVYVDSTDYDEYWLSRRYYGFHANAVGEATLNVTAKVFDLTAENYYTEALTVSIPVSVYDDERICFDEIPVLSTDSDGTQTNYLGKINIDNFTWKQKSDGSYSVSFDAYNAKNFYGAVCVYNEDGELTDAVIINKYEEYATKWVSYDSEEGITSELWDKLCENLSYITSYVNGDVTKYNWYRTGDSAEKTEVSVTVPEGGYITISTSMENPVVWLYNTGALTLELYNFASGVSIDGDVKEKVAEEIADKAIKEVGINYISKFVEKLIEKYTEEQITTSLEDAYVMMDANSYLMECLAMDADEYKEMYSEIALSTGLSVSVNAILDITGLSAVKEAMKTLSTAYECGNLIEFMANYAVYTKDASSGMELQYYAPDTGSGMVEVEIEEPALSAISNVSSGVKLTWDKVDDADGYYIYRRTGTGNYTKVKTITSSSTLTWTDTNVSSGTTYSYYIAAYSGSDVSEESDASTITFLSSCSVSYINNTMDGFKVVWGKVSGASGYYIYRRNDDGTYSTTPTATVTGGSTTEWIDPLVLTGGKDYTYKVAAYYKNSSGTISVGSSGTTKTCKYLKGGEVTSVTNTSSGLKVAWTKVAGANGYYIFRKSSSDSDYTQVATVSGTSAVGWTDTSSLTSGKNYTYKVSAIFTNSKGQVTKGGAKTTKTTKYLTPGKISSLTNTSTGITVKWTKVSGASGYYVYRKASSASSYTLVKTITSVGTVSYTDTAVKSKNGTTYTYYVIPYYKNSSGAVTKGAYSATKKTVRLTAVSLSSVKNSSSKKMTVKWAKNSKATGYEIQYSTSSSFASGNKTVTVSSASTVSKVISSLTKGKTYYVRVRAYKTVSGTKYYSAWSTKKSVKISK